MSPYICGNKLQTKCIASEQRDNCQLRQGNEIQIFDSAKYKQELQLIPEQRGKPDDSLTPPSYSLSGILIL